MKKVLITDDVHPLLISGLTARGYDCDYNPQITLENTRQIVEYYAGLVINSKIKADKSLLEKGSKLEFIARLGSGLEIIDLDEARACGITILSAPEGNCNAVAEHAVGMLLSLLNHLNRADREVRQLLWNREKNRGRELKGLTVGIIGYGHTGPAFSEKLSGFGVKVLAYDKFNPIETTLKHVNICDLKTIQNQADIISLHVSLNPSSHHLVDQAFIEGCAKPFILINTARGKAVRLEDLIWGLEKGKIVGACLDVFENEKPTTFSELEKDLYSRLYEMDQVILSPHIAGWTYESKERIAEVLLKKLDGAKKN
ncbi:MAG: hypothetical protein IPL46_09220 [Saprospiraceae bacterium]|nr:hypothetical protein [Saprospiraceae bacterium]